MEKDRLINGLMSQVACNSVTAQYVDDIARTVEIVRERNIGTDDVLREIALHMAGYGMRSVDHLLDGVIGGIEHLGGPDEFKSRIAYGLLGKV